METSDESINYRKQVWKKFREQIAKMMFETGGLAGYALQVYDIKEWDLPRLQTRLDAFRLRDDKKQKVWGHLLCSHLYLVGLN